MTKQKNNTCSIKARNQIVDPNPLGLKALITGENIDISLRSTKRMKVRKANRSTVIVENAGAFQLDLLDPDLLLTNIRGITELLDQLTGVAEKEEYLRKVKMVLIKNISILEKAWKEDEDKLDTQIAQKERVRHNLEKNSAGSRAEKKMIKTLSAEIDQLRMERGRVRRKSYADYAEENKRCREVNEKKLKIDRQFATKNMEKSKTLR